MKNFSTQELKQYNGIDGKGAYFAYEGKVYDATGSKFWIEGEHYGWYAGDDLTGKMDDAPHGEEVLEGFLVVGTYGEVQTNSTPLFLGIGVVLVISVVVLAFFLKRKKKNKK